MGDPRRRRPLPALVTLLALALLLGAAALGAAALTACGSSAESDPLAGYWIGGPAKQQVLIHVVKNGDTYKVLGSPNAPLGTATKDGDSLLIDTHAVEMRFVPAGTDKLTFEIGGEAFKKTRTIALSRVDETQYADAATAFGIAAIRQGLMMWVGGGGKKFPPPSEVSATGVLGKMVVPWPPNLFSGGTMQEGDGEGDYTYTVTDGGKAFELVGHLSDGSTTTGPSGAPSLP